MVRCHPQEKEMWHGLVARVEPFDAFIATTGLNSMYFWTGKEPVGPVLLSHEIRVIPEALQVEIARRLLEVKHPMVLVRENITPLSIEGTPLMRIIRKSLVLAGEPGMNYELVRPEDRMRGR